MHYPPAQSSRVSQVERHVDLDRGAWANLIRAPCFPQFQKVGKDRNFVPEGEVYCSQVATWLGRGPRKINGTGRVVICSAVLIGPLRQARGFSKGPAVLHLRERFIATKSPPGWGLGRRRSAEQAGRPPVLLLFSSTRSVKPAPFRKAPTLAFNFLEKLCMSLYKVAMNLSRSLSEQAIREYSSLDCAVGSLMQGTQ